MNSFAARVPMRARPSKLRKRPVKELLHFFDLLQEVENNVARDEELDAAEADLEEIERWLSLFKIEHLKPEVRYVPDVLHSWLSLIKESISQKKSLACSAALADKCIAELNEFENLINFDEFIKTVQFENPKEEDPFEDAPLWVIIEKMCPKNSESLCPLWMAESFSSLSKLLQLYVADQIPFIPF